MSESNSDMNTQTTSSQTNNDESINCGSSCNSNDCQTWSQWANNQWKRQWVRCTAYTVAVGLVGVSAFYSHRTLTNRSGSSSSISLRRVSK